MYLINTTSPFISEEDINNSFNVLDFFKLDKVIGVLKQSNNFYSHNGKTLNKLMTILFYGLKEMKYLLNLELCQFLIRKNV